VNNLINLLKKKLKKYGYDANLIQSHREQGYRFAVRRRNARSLKGVACDAWL
jgi:DNA-binding response OmpR family regulator